MVCRMELPYNEILNKSNIKKIGAKATGYTLLAGIHEIGDPNVMSKSVLPNEIKKQIIQQIILD